MSEKRFSETEKGCYFTSLVLDNQTQEELGTPKVVVLLNMFEDDVQVKDKKIEEQQTIIEAKDSLLSIISEENEQLRKKTEMDKNDFFISEAKRMRLLAFIEDNGLRKEYFEWERRIYE